MSSATRKIPTLAVLHLADLFRNPKMEIPSLLDWKKVKRFLKGEWPKEIPKYRVESVASSCRDWFARANNAPYVAIDTEYNVDTNYLLLIGLGFPNASHVLQFDHKVANWYEKQEFAKLLRTLVANVPIVFQNAVADIPVMELAYGIKYEDYKHIEDTMLAHAVLWSDWPHTLEFLASVYGQHNKMKHLAERDQYLYNTGDVVDTISVWEGLKSELKQDPRTENIYRSQSLCTVPIVLRSVRCGLKLDNERVDKAMRELLESRNWASTIAKVYAGYPINIGSDDQLKFYLYEQEKLPVQFVPKSDKPTVDGDAISALRSFVGTVYDPDEEAKSGLSCETALQYIREGAHPLLEARVVYAAAQQQLSHYIYPLFNSDKEGNILGVKERIYPRFLVHGQASGRWSTVDPPMAQFPKKLQDVVIPDEGERWIEWDWNQIELRILSALSGDTIYEEAFKKDWDIHTINTCDIFGWSYPSNLRNPHTSSEDHTWRSNYKWGGKDDPRRRFAKVFVFRLNYGGEAKTATDIPGVKQLGLTSSKLVHGSRMYLNKHPHIRQYWETITRDGLEKREVRTFMGRRRRLLVDGRNSQRRLIYNHPMQGGVSDIFNTTLIKVAQALPYATFKYGVHDAQKWSVPEGKYEEAKEIIYEIVHTPWDIGGKKIVFPADFK